MEKLKNISLSKGGNTFNLAIQLTGGGAAITLWEDESPGTVVKKLEELITKLKAGVLDRALQ